MQLVVLTIISFLLLHGSHHSCIDGMRPLELSSPPPTQSRTVTSALSVFLSTEDACPALFVAKSPRSQWEEGLVG